MKKHILTPENAILFLILKLAPVSMMPMDSEQDDIKVPVGVMAGKLYYHW